MKPGTIVRLPDGREGTVVYHGLDGYGIRWGRVGIDSDKILQANPLFGDKPVDYEYEPEAMLREDYPSADVPCVGEKYEVIREA